MSEKQIEAARSGIRKDLAVRLQREEIKQESYFRYIEQHKDTNAGELGAFKDGFDAGYKAAQSAGEWVPIKSEADLPKEDGRYFLLVRYIEDGTLIPVGSGFAASERSPWAFIVSRNAYRPKPIVEAVAWMPIPPYTEPEADK